MVRSHCLTESTDSGTISLKRRPYTTSSSGQKQSSAAAMDTYQYLNGPFGCNQLIDLTSDDDFSMQIMQEEEDARLPENLVDYDGLPADYGDHENDAALSDSAGSISGCSHHTECMCRYQESDSSISP
ncbi:uncharacterized protein [Miscanthus floridulus]|uniref:uncharacterized protein isoform X2 n=1 Tax=Miscanthus floridulus TaxID=154761 RepID=UPI00345854CC